MFKKTARIISKKLSFYNKGGDHHVCGNNGFGGRYYQNTQITGPTTATYTSGSIVNMSAWVLISRKFFKMSFN